MRRLQCDAEHASISASSNRALMACGLWDCACGGVLPPFETFAYALPKEARMRNGFR